MRDELGPGARDERDRATFVPDPDAYEWPEESLRTEEHRDSEGWLSRLDGPAIVRRLDDGGVIYRGWYVDGLLHREDGPAEEYLGPDGIRHEFHLHRGALHRDDGPAETFFHANGKVSLEGYYRYSKIHRADGPALLTYAVDGSKVAENFYLDGEEFSAEEFAPLAEALAGGAPVEWARAFARGDTRP